MTPSLLSLVSLLKSAKADDQMLLVAGLIDGLSDGERVMVRTEAMAQGVELLPRNLYFNYETQVWID